MTSTIFFDSVHHCSAEESIIDAILFSLKSPRKESGFLIPDISCLNSSGCVSWRKLYSVSSCIPATKAEAVNACLGFPVKETTLLAKTGPAMTPVQCM